MSDQGILMIGVPRRLDAEELAGLRGDAVGGNQQLRGQVASVLETNARLALVDAQRLHGSLDEHDTRGADRLQARARERPALDDEA
jgi:hypothetical protein